MKCRSHPWRLAVLDSSGASNCHTVAVTLPFCPGIDMFQVADNNMKVKRTLKTSIEYRAVAAVNEQTLAVGHYAWNAHDIDLIDLGGRVLRQICDHLTSVSMLGGSVYVLCQC
ncbi:hypothetical protein PoB_002956400 [Plakobranchus ocellatus]|uniref:Uncharacterized protein n=1 Tax=Plakobranchus ocellatus TaxID=259542 RepID=A0AAV4AA00_9GAST|nr:hypothetical protein PoB_002956400 [Plakobranchus ocellatus]